MKLILIALLAACTLPAQRPLFHFTPDRDFMNDPNGLVFFRGEYHLFYQHNPHGITWGHMSWGHAVSRDLLRWQHLPVALREENGEMIFSGSAVLDSANTSGLCRGGPCLIAFYTGHRTAVQTQNIAYSNDAGRTWTKYAGNPVIDLGMKDFRDPKVFRHQPTKKWVMVAALPAERKVRFFGSKDLKKWDALSDFGPEGSTEGIWECPDLFPLSVDGDPQRVKWVLDVDVNGGTPAGGSGGQYFLGTFDGVRFRNDNPASLALWVDYGKDFYASQSYENLKDRRVWIGWLSNWQYANVEPTSPWRGMQSLPRELSLRTTPQGVRLFQAPVRELEALRGRKVTDPGALRAEAFDLIAEIEPGPAECGFRVRKGGGAETLVGIAGGRLFVDRSRSGQTAFHKEFPGRRTAPLRDARRIELRIVGDAGSVEVFAHGGEIVISERIFPPEGASGIEFYSADGKAKLAKFEGWELRAR